MNPQPNRFFHLSLIFLLALNLVPHFNDHTVPTLAVGGLCLAWRLLYEFQQVPLPNILTKIGLVAVLTYLVYSNYGQILGLEAGSALLICAVSLKLIDRVGYRDAMVLLFLNFMLLLARFFESQSLGISIFAVFDLVITTALLVQLHNGSRVKFDLPTLLKTGGKLFLQITPFMILLFFVFPRFSTGFLSLQTRRPPLKGFSESMEPGAIASLAQDDISAFRVRFYGKVPSPLDMYWRGGILAANNEMSWSRGKLKKKKALRPVKNLNEIFRQEVLLEPVFNDWIFALDKPIWIEHHNQRLQRNTIKVDGSIFMLKKSYDKKYVYDAFSTENNQESLSPKLKKVYLQSPEITDPRVLSLVEGAKWGAKNSEHIALRLMKFYQKQFRYTLKPGKMKSKKIAEFLFETKVGFCEHFAVSFAALMRLAGVPSRVIVGFQGGRKNKLSDYYLVTSKDAHAWTEIWSEEQSKWLRFDPTIMVSPLRLELGGDIYHSMNEEELQQARSGGDYLSQYQEGWLKQAYFAVDALATNWNLFLLNYDESGQRSFFARLGFKNVNQNMLLTLSLLILLSFFLFVRIRNRNKQKPVSLAQRAYLELRGRLARKGIEKESFEGPSDFLKRVQEEVPGYNKEIEAFRLAYLESYYGLSENETNFKELVKRIR